MLCYAFSIADYVASNGIDDGEWGNGEGIFERSGRNVVECLEWHKHDKSVDSRYPGTDSKFAPPVTTSLARYR